MTSSYPCRDRLMSLAHYAQRQIELQQFASIAWSIEHSGSVIAHGAEGNTDHAAKTPVVADTLYRLYSMTKPIVSVCCLQLIESGKLRLDDPVSHWVPAFAKQQILGVNGEMIAVGRSMTIEDLLTHRSGLSYDFLPDCGVAERYREAGLAADGHRSLEELVGLLAQHPLAFQPGERWYYGYSTDVLAHVIELVCARPLADCLQHSLFAPLGMNETGFQVSEKQQHRVADMFGQRELGEVDQGLHTCNRLTPMNVENSYPLSAEGTFTRGGIGLYSTLSDYQRFMCVLVRGLSPDGQPILSAPMVDLLWQNRLTSAQIPIAIGGRAFSGYGWGLSGRVMSDTSQSSILTGLGEGGWAGAAGTYFWVDRRHEFSGVVMTQYLGSVVPVGTDMQTIAYGALCNA